MERAVTLGPSADVAPPSLVAALTQKASQSGAAAAADSAMAAAAVDVGARATCAIAASDLDVHDSALVESRLAPVAFAFHLPLGTRLRIILDKLARTRAPVLPPGAASSPRADASDDGPSSSSEAGSR